MTSAELKSLLPASAPFFAADVSYAKPTFGWLLGTFWTYFWNDRTNKGLLNWTRKNDCDNFARAYAQAAADCHALSNGSDLEGLAVGEFWYLRDIGGEHAVVAAFTDQGLVFLEPQTGQRLYLSDKEIFSCLLAYF